MFLMDFMWFSVIVASFRVPLGFLWASFLEELATPFWMSKKVAPGTPKDSLLGGFEYHLGAFQVPFQRI